MATKPAGKRRAPNKFKPRSTGSRTKRKSANIQKGDRVCGRFGPLVSEPPKTRKVKALLYGIVVAEAGVQKNKWHVRWDSQHEDSRGAKPDGISSSKLKRVDDDAGVSDDEGNEEWVVDDEDWQADAAGIARQPWPPR